MDGLKQVPQKQKPTGHWAAENMALTWSKGAPSMPDSTLRDGLW
jgi:hypothetical protein